MNTSLAHLDFVLYRSWGVRVVEVDESQHDHMPHAGLRDRTHAERRGAARAALAGDSNALCRVSNYLSLILQQMQP